MEDTNKDLKILEEIKDMFVHLKNYGYINDIKKDIDTDKAIQAIESTINRYKELEEENIQLEACKDEVIRRYNFESIPVSLVEEKIEEYTKLLKNCNRFSDIDRIKAINERVLELEELLEKDK